MAEDVVVGLDIGTQSSKLVACRADGGIVAEERIAHDTMRPHPGHFEQDAEAVWWHDVVTLLRRIGERDDLRPQALAISALGPSSVPTDESGAPLRPGILYGIDTRARDEIAALEARYGRAAIVAASGSAVSSQSPVPKLLWLKAHEPEVHAAMRRWFTAQSWVVHRLTGAFVIDPHSASQCVPLFDCGKGAWREDVWADLFPGQPMPRLAWPNEIVGALTAEAAKAVGLTAGIPVVAGSIDAWSEAYSAFADDPGTGMIMYGSTYFFIANTPSFVSSEHFWGTRGMKPGVFCLAGGMATGGIVLNWLSKLFSVEVGEVVRRALARISGPSALLATPYLSGERTPFFDPDVRATLFGMDFDTDADAVFAAFVLGMALASRDNLDAMHAEIGSVPDYVAVGGGAASEPLLQLISDVTGVVQRVPRRTVGAALGDARLAAEAIGWEVSRDAWNPIARLVEPGAGAKDRYAPMFARFKGLYRVTQPLQLPGGML